MNIHIVYAVVDYEDDYVFRAFTSRRKAKAFLDRCYRHSERRPRIPANPNTKDWERFDKDFAAWRKKCPMGEKWADIDNFRWACIGLVK